MVQYEVRPSVQRQPVHPSITADQISQLVDRFYERVLANEKLGSIFAHHAGPHWARHLDTMKGFWRSVLLRTGEYKGKPVPVHQKIDGIDTCEFEEWLSLFELTTAEIFSPNAAPLVNEAAARIATSLWLSRDGNLLATPPNWRKALSNGTELAN